MDKKNGKQVKKTFREIRYEEKRAAIIKCAARAFGKRGYHAVTIEDITAELLMTKGSIYYYFSTKEELLYEAHMLSLRKVLDRILEINKTDDSPDIKVKRAICSHLEVLALDFEGAFSLQHEFHLPPDLLDEVIKVRDLYEENFVQIIRDGVDKGFFRVRNPKLAAYIILGSINWFLRWYSSEGRWSLEEICDNYVDLLTNGLLTGSAESIPVPRKK